MIAVSRELEWGAHASSRAADGVLAVGSAKHAVPDVRREDASNSTRGRVRSPILALVTLLLAVTASAHEVRPAFLELTERASGEFDVLWKVPAMGGAPLAGEEIPHEQPALSDDPGPTKAMPCGCPAPTAPRSRGVVPIHPSLPKDAETISLQRTERLFGAEIKRWTIRVPHGLEGWEVTVHGLSATMVDVLVRVAFADGRVVSRMLRPDAPSFVFTKETAGPAAGGYIRLGVEHILLGIDHLLFVLALVLIVRGVGLLVKTITAFTVAHSITLALATLGVVHVPSAPVEAVIALSIVFVASEILRMRSGVAQTSKSAVSRVSKPASLPNSTAHSLAESPADLEVGDTAGLETCATRSSLTARAPWLVAGTFGLLHGFGFAGALSQVGLPANDIPLALLFFNVGVEAGQLAFVVVALGVIALGRRVHRQLLPSTLNPQLSTFLRLMPPYAIGSVAMFWVIQRTAAIW